MVGPRTRLSSLTSLAFTLLLGLLAPACQSALSVDEARQAPMAMRPAPFAPPPRTVTDILAILDQQQGANSQIALRDLADAPPPPAGADALADFYRKRGLAAGRIGRAKQELDDLNKATEYLLQTLSPVYWIYPFLALAEERDGNYFRYLRYLRMSGETSALRRYFPGYGGITVGPLAWPDTRLALGYASIGDARAAEVALQEATRWYARASVLPTSRAYVFIHAQAVLLDATGRHAEAEAVARKLIALLVNDREWAQLRRSPSISEVHAFLARTLIRQGRLLEAESEAREAALGAVAGPGYYSPQTAAWMLRSLVWVLLAQGRSREAETLARAVIEIFEK